ncbi:unnamed protein product [Echinostoma caproni]|uniref:DUF4536 domain-containing protein n=1 Tax=Echinostoma caproni TaxID=27848 RepID=A0A183B5R4_9TREM|nr:unnamed protein product [Echinostoma caproni]
MGEPASTTATSSSIHATSLEESGSRKNSDNAKGDQCVSCKWVAVALPVTLSGYIFYVAKQQCTRFSGAQRMVYMGLCGGLSLGLLYLGAKDLLRRLPEESSK